MKFAARFLAAMAAVRGQLSIVVVGAIVASVALAACGGTDDPAGNAAEETAIRDGANGFQSLAPAELAEMLSAKDFPLINVHIPYEGEIDDTDLFIPYDEIERNLASLPDDKQANIVLYCRSGSMSAIAAETLVRLGFTNVSHLDGGMIAWEAAGYPLLQREGSIDNSVP